MKLDIIATHVSEMLKSLSALITAESIIVVCSYRLAQYHKYLLHIILTIISKYNICFITFFDIFEIIGTWILRRKCPQLLGHNKETNILPK